MKEFIITILAFVTMLGIINAYSGSGDDDDEYLNNDFSIENNILFKIDKHTRFKFPLSQELQAIYAIGYWSTKFAMGNANYNDMMVGIANPIINNMIPIPDGFGTLMSSYIKDSSTKIERDKEYWSAWYAISPSVVSPIKILTGRRNFLGSKLETTFNDKRANVYRGTGDYPIANDFFKMLFNLGGGYYDSCSSVKKNGKYVSALFDYNPSVSGAFIESYNSGGVKVISSIYRGIRYGMNDYKGNFNPSSVPVFGTFFERRYEDSYRREIRGELDDVANRMIELQKLNEKYKEDKYFNDMKNKARVISSSLKKFEEGRYNKGKKANINIIKKDDADSIYKSTANSGAELLDKIDEYMNDIE